ncbi:hypothetical protein GK047_17780 [Paenibacillus sp. SYP-B3998]|uniref:Class 1 isoprenoid biosynthesis enzyme n=1 Tax=Paenibacillus sp. SYP-B3998 TaxID=2678564 RepID=A0A6G4A065_9BACL|nr:hypothetical protein [Paenibacillus sp. SYP-B3998]NEW07853.1 hypothetical protein [Paenibacillus sp. SYP-B3998]
MNWFEAYKDQLTEVFTESERIISKFPAPLDRLGLDYLAKFDASKEDSTKNYICYLLPFWMSDLTPLLPETIKKFSLANIFGMLYFFIQDDIMDSSTSEHKEKLPSGNLFYLQFLTIYRDLFPSESPFWTYYNEYVIEWSDAVTNESQANYFMNDIRMVAKKASPVKIASTGALLLSNRTQLVSEVSRAIEHVLVTLQMLDDWADWEQDLEDASYNCLLAMLHAHLKLPLHIPLSKEVIKQQVYVHDFVGLYAQVASTTHQLLLNLGLQAHLPQLYAFHEYLIEKLLADGDQITKNRQVLALGGFHNLLSKVNEQG